LVLLRPVAGPADLNLPGRHLGIFLLADEVKFGDSDLGMTREFPHLVHGRAVADRVVDGGLA
jgi:hypothetical protein